MDLLLGLFTVGTFWFWLVTVALFVIVTASVECESGVWATIWLFTGIFGFGAVCHWSIGKAEALLITHPIIFISWLVCYIGLGIGWSIFKWYMKLKKEANSYNTVKADFLKSKGVTELTPELASEFQSSPTYWTKTSEPLSAKSYKDDIIRWIAYWPFSMIGFVFREFFIKIFDNIYELLQGTYQKMSNNVFKDISYDNAMAAAYAKERKIKKG
jgi:hypothetical protein